MTISPDEAFSSLQNQLARFEANPLEEANHLATTVSGLDKSLGREAFFKLITPEIQKRVDVLVQKLAKDFQTASTKKPKAISVKPLESKPYTPEPLKPTDATRIAEDELIQKWVSHCPDFKMVIDMFARVDIKSIIVNGIRIDESDEAELKRRMKALEPLTAKQRDEFKVAFLCEKILQHIVRQDRSFDVPKLISRLTPAIGKAICYSCAEMNPITNVQDALNCLQLFYRDQIPYTIVDKTAEQRLKIYLVFDFKSRNGYPIAQVEMHSAFLLREMSDGSDVVKRVFTSVLTKDFSKRDSTWTGTLQAMPGMAA